MIKLGAEVNTHNPSIRKVETGSSRGLPDHPTEFSPTESVSSRLSETVCLESKNVGTEINPTVLKLQYFVPPECQSHQRMGNLAGHRNC